MVINLKGREIEISVWCDSQCAICHSNNQMFHERTKLVDVKLPFIRYILAPGSVGIKKVAIEENLADLLTKLQPWTKLKHCWSLVNVKKMESPIKGYGEQDQLQWEIGIFKIFGKHCGTLTERKLYFVTSHIY